MSIKIILNSALFFCAVSFIVFSCRSERESNKLTASARIADELQSYDQLESIKERKKRLAETMTQPIPVMKLVTSDAGATLAQEILLSQPQINTFYTLDGSPMFCEVFSCNKALPSDLGNATMNINNIYKIEVYNFAKNATLTGFVDIQSKQIVKLDLQEQSAPDVPEHLKRIAVDIAIHSDQVKKELGNAPEIEDAQMAYTKTALNNSKCERSLHLCVAPTFIKGEKALWSIVDLTDLKLVGTRWTYVGDPGPVMVSERRIQNDEIASCYCEKEKKLERNGWSFSYMLTSSDGVKIKDVTYKGKKIYKDVKLVDWHVSYSNTEGFGYSDGVGCPEYSTSAVTAWDMPKISDLMDKDKRVGFVLEQVFKSEGWPSACNYNYVQRYEFYDDGSFRPVVASIGRGCGSDGTYRPVLRIALEGKNDFSSYEGSGYKPWVDEQWHLQMENTRYDKDGALFKITGTQNLRIIPGNGQFGDGGRGDNAYTYVTKFNPNEGESDLSTIGPCCNNDYRQGPEKFINKESLTASDIVMWYVPQMKNDGRKGSEYCWAEAKIINGQYKTITYPCFAGPMFRLN